MCAAFSTLANAMYNYFDTLFQKLAGRSWHTYQGRTSESITELSAHKTFVPTSHTQAKQESCLAVLYSHTFTHTAAPDGVRGLHV